MQIGGESPLESVFHIPCSSQHRINRIFHIVVVETELVWPATCLTTIASTLHGAFALSTLATIGDGIAAN